MGKTLFRLICSRARVLARVFALIVLSCLASGVAAQEGTPPLRVGWTLAPPFFQYDSSGRRSGAVQELVERIAEEIGFDIRVTPYVSAEAMVDGYLAGELDVIPGPLGSAALREISLTSLPVSKGTIRKYVAPDRRTGLDWMEAPGLRVGYVMPARLPVFDAALEGNVEVPMNAIGDAILALISGDIDILLSSEETAQAWAFRAGLDHRLAAVGEPLQEIDRVIQLQRSRSELLAPINRAITTLRERGTLAALRSKYRMDAFDPEPAVLTVGVRNYPPFQFVTEEGEFDGFAIEVFRALAEMAELDYRFTEISAADLREGPRPGSFDMVPLLSIDDRRRQFGDFTLPIEESQLGIHMRSGEQAGINDLSDLAGRKVAVIPKSLLHADAQAIGGLEIVEADSPAEMLEMLVGGEVDAILSGQVPVVDWMRQQDRVGEVEMVQPPLIFGQRAVAMRFGLGGVRERLNAVIPAFLLSAEFETLRQTYRGGEPAFWTESRKRRAIGLASVTGLLLLVLGLAATLNMRARRQAEAAQRQAEQLSSQRLEISNQLRAVMDAAQSGIVGLNRLGQVAIANPLGLAMLDADALAIPFEIPVRMNFADSRGVPLISRERHPFNRALAGEELRGELYLISKGDGRDTVRARISSTQIPEKVSSEMATVLVIADVTEQERNRERVERAERLGAIGQLTGGVAHDFNNLLAVILGRQELLRDDLEDEELLEHVEASIGAAERGADLTRSMLAFARKAPLEAGKIGLNQLVMEIRDWIERTLPADIELVAELAANPDQVKVDPGAAESALLNMILNARDAMPTGGGLTIGTENVTVGAERAGPNREVGPGRYVVLSVSDTGHGIPLANLDRVFDPFFTTKAEGKGSGLGLAMTLGFVEQSGGRATVESTPDRGTTFRLWFPAPETNARIEGRATEAPAPLSSSQRILVAEDNAEVLAVLVATLRRAGYRVEVAENGDLALSIFEADQAFDLLVTDIMMPGLLKGPDLAQAIRKLAPDLPVIFMSGYADDAFSSVSLQGSVTRLGKPVARADLLAAVRRALGD